MNSPGKNIGEGSHPFSRGSSRPQDWTWVPHIAGRFFTAWAPREALGWWLLQLPLHRLSPQGGPRMMASPTSLHSHRMTAATALDSPTWHPEVWKDDLKLGSPLSQRKVPPEAPPSRLPSTAWAGSQVHPSVSHYQGHKSHSCQDSQVSRLGQEERPRLIRHMASHSWAEPWLH